VALPSDPVHSSAGWVFFDCYESGRLAHLEFGPKLAGFWEAVEEPAVIITVLKKPL
jgi:hypothetical protein